MSLLATVIQIGSDGSLVLYRETDGVGEITGWGLLAITGACWLLKSLFSRG